MLFSHKQARTSRRHHPLWNILLAMAAWAGILLAYARQKKENRFISVGGYAWSRVTSPSMEPAVCTHDLVLIHRQPDYAVGDVVIYRRPSDKALIIHRIVRKQKDSFVTKGDANDFLDAPIRLQDIQGKMIRKTSRFSGLVGWICSPFGFGLLLAWMMAFCLMEDPSDS